jgi:hypothetical protein
MTDTNEYDVLGFKSQGLDNSLIAKAIGCEEALVPQLVEEALVKQYGSTVIPPAILIELTRLDRLIAVMFDDLSNAEDVYSEFTGKMERDGFKTRANITSTIDKLVNTKIKLLNLSLVYKVATEEEVSDTVDVNSMSLQEKLDKFRALLET